MDTEPYSILMSVYSGENPEYLRQAMDSMFLQTVPSDDFVLVCDGPLTPPLDAVITSFTLRYPHILRVIRLDEHQGLAAALNTGLRQCRHELIARMDSDDISLPHRCQAQLACFSRQRNLAILSGTVVEFDQSPSEITGKRQLPSGHGEICRYSRTRSPFNHPAVMYRKSAVTSVGGYLMHYPLLEDYDLWVRMLRAGFRGENLREPLLLMRTGSGMYRRRRGSRYAGCLLAFHRALLGSGWSSAADYLSCSIPHAIACLLPLPLLRQVYRVLHH